MVDRRRVRRLLQRIADDLSFLAARAQRDPSELLGQAEPMAAIKYVFVTAIEGCLDVAQHLCASEGWGPPTTNADAIRILGRQGVLHEDVAQAVSVAVGFRNVLVHGYVDVDDGRVVGFLERLDDLRQFIEQVSGFVAGAEED